METKVKRELDAMAAIDSRIMELEERLEKIEGAPTEVYSRIVGYYKNINAWNKGKKAEFKDRVTFKLDC